MTAVPLKKTTNGDNNAKDYVDFFQVKTQLNFDVIPIISNKVSSKIKEIFYYLVYWFWVKTFQIP